MKVPSSRRRLTRRHVLKTGAAALGAGTAALNAPPALQAQSIQAPAIVAGAQAGRPFRGLVRHGSTFDYPTLRHIEPKRSTRPAAFV